MAIRVDYTPPSAAPALYSAALAASQQDYLNRRRQEAMQVAELQQRDAQQRRALAANMYSQAASQRFNAGQATLDRNMRMGLAAAEMQQQQARLQGDRQLQIDRDLWQARQQEERDARLFDRQLAGQADLGMRQAEDDRRAFLLKEYDDGRLTLTDASRRQLGQIRSHMSAVRGARNLTPQEKNAQLAELDSKFWDIMGNPSPQLPGERAKPMPQRVRENTFKEPVYTPDGKFMGWKTWTEETRNGEKRFTSTFDAFKPPSGAGKQQDPEKEFIDFAQGFAGKTKGSGDEAKPYNDEDIWKLWQQQQKLLKRFRGQVPKGQTPEEYAATVNPAMRDRVLGALQGQQPPAAPPQSGLGEPPMAADDPRRVNPLLPQGGQPQPPPPAQPTDKLMWQDYEEIMYANPDMDAGEIRAEVLRRRGIETGIEAAKKEVAKWTAGLPPVPSVEAAKRMLPGHYRLPDGRVVEVTP